MSHLPSSRNNHLNTPTSPTFGACDSEPLKGDVCPAHVGKDTTYPPASRGEIVAPSTYIYI